MVWENYISQEEEDKLVRAGSMPKSKNEVILSKDSKLSLLPKGGREHYATSLNRCGYGDHVPKEPGPQRCSRSDPMRCTALCMTGTTPRFWARRQKACVQARRFDGMLHQELRWLSREVGTLDAGMEYYLGHEELASWRLLDPVVATLPDQGVEKSSAPARKRKAAEETEEDHAAQSR